LLVPYSTYAKYLKWLTISLFAYVGVVFFIHVPWPAVLHATPLPHIQLTKEYLTAIVAVLERPSARIYFFGRLLHEVKARFEI
jgi:Mn2+/Fe2+ NRAMP family transporter